MIHTEIDGDAMTGRDQPPSQVVWQFDAFYRDRYRPLVAAVHALTGNRWTAEDLVQEAFLRAHRDWDRVQHAGSPEAWVRRVAVNLAVSRFRRLRAETAARLRLAPQRHEFQPLTAEHEAFWAEVRRLPPRQRQTIVLRYVEDLSTREIGAVLEIAEGTVRALLTQARTRLARQLQAKGWHHD